jgi:hypothetical protein
MELFFAFIFGILLKLYDDIIDLKINVNNFLILFLQILISVFTIVAVDKYSIIAVIITFALIVSNFCKKFDDIFWNYYLCLNILLSFIFYKNISLFKVNFVNISLIILFIIAIFYEENRFTGEFNVLKTKSRCYSIIFSSIFLFLITFFNFIKKYSLEFFVLIIIFINAYFLTSIIINKLFTYNFIYN